MTKVEIQPPQDAGVTRITVFAPDGRMFAAPKLVVPPTGTFEFDAPKPGTCTARLEALGAGNVLWSFPVEGAAALTVRAPSLDPLRAAKPHAAAGRMEAGRPNLTGEIAAVEAEIDDDLGASASEFPPAMFGFGVGQNFLSGVPLEAVPAATTMESFKPASGPAYDSRPLSYGGWRPFTGDKTVHMRHTDSGDLEIYFERGEELLPANSGARLRLSFAIEATRVQRLLVPLFAGGVTVRLRKATTTYLTKDTLSIVPSHAETHALMQALTSNSTEVATSIWEEIRLGPAYLARYANADISDDPWLSVAVALLMLRLGWLDDHAYWLERLAQEHPWVADANILAARQRLAQPSPDVDGALKHLQRAGRVGAVYFFEANRLRGDLLVSLAADAPQEEQRQLATIALARWRNNLANQFQVGAFFSWLMTHGARTHGGLDRRYSSIVDAGRLIALRADPRSPQRSLQSESRGGWAISDFKPSAPLPEADTLPPTPSVDTPLIYTTTYGSGTGRSDNPTLRKAGTMTIDLKVYDNGDHTCLVWLPTNAQAIPNCRGFAVHRTRKPAAGGPIKDEYLHGFVGFSDDDKLDPNAPWKHPLQRYMWWDYLVDPGDVLQYSIVPVVGPDKDHLTLSPADGSAQTPPMTITGQASAHISAYFNKGIVSAQWVSRARKRRQGRQARRSDRANRELAAQCAERSAAPEIARYAR
jgi:hypothetical protein